MLRALVKLLARGVGFGSGVGRGELFLIIRRALFAHIRFGVPANIRANPFAATRALVEKLLGLFYGSSKGIIVRLAADGTLDVIRIIADA